MKLLDQVRHVIRKKHYSIRTEQAYTNWIKRFILFHGKRHPKDMGETEISKYISYLAVKRNVSASTQNQALNAIVFLYKQILNRELGDFGSMERAKIKRIFMCGNEALGEAAILAGCVQHTYWSHGFAGYGGGRRCTREWLRTWLSGPD